MDRLSNSSSWDQTGESLETGDDKDRPEPTTVGKDLGDERKERLETKKRKQLLLNNNKGEIRTSQDEFDMSSPNKEKKNLDRRFDALLLEPLLAFPHPGSVGR